jgi:predicted dehydrogenase
MKSLNRRTFLKSTALGAAAATLPARSWAQVAGSNSDVRVAVVGFGGRGQDHINNFAKLEGVRVTALCDVDSTILRKEIDKFKKQDKAVEQFSDIRKLLESKNIDVVSIATPNHWHALGAIWAVQAGKDVYVEKPVSHNVFEGRKLVEAARKYKKIVQTGTQSRSSLAGIGEAVKWVNEGNLGKIVIARGLCYKPRGSIGKVDKAQQPPADVDYDLWSGPAPILPIMRKRFHYDWHWIWAYGNGDLGNQGIHQMDICRWFLGEKELAPYVLSAGGRLGYEDDGETANTQVIFQGYEKAPLIFEVRGLPERAGAKNMDKYKGAGVGCVIECEGGYISVPSYTQSTAHDKDGKVIKEWKGGGNHYENFLKAVHSRKHEDLNADILEGHLSSALCHTGNVSYLLGAKKNPDEIKEALKDQRGMVETFGRMAEHLARNNVDIEQSKVTLGVPLKMNPKTEKFIGNADANALLTRNYRAPYIVPDKV